MWSSFDGPLMRGACEYCVQTCLSHPRHLELPEMAWDDEGTTSMCEVFINIQSTRDVLLAPYTVSLPVAN